jgi:thioesterase domain-containing protein
LQTPGVDGEAAPLTDYAAIAAHHVATIRAHQPSGPYVLAGWSMGGSLAFEMAAQLERSGEVVSRLVLIGATPPSEDHLEAARATMQGYEPWRMAYFYVRSLSLSLGRPIALGLRDLEGLPEPELYRRVIALVESIGPIGLAIDDVHARRWLGVVRTTLHAFHHHHPAGTFSGKALVVRAADPNPLGADELVRARPVPPGSWDALLTGRVDECVANGNHYTLMLDPFVANVAATVGGWLREAIS